MLNRPEDDDVLWLETFVAVLVATTVALGIAAPVESVTVPVMAPAPAVWALSDVGIAIGSVATSKKIALHAVFAKLRWKMLCVESMMTSIEISSVDLPGLIAGRARRRISGRW
jgi:hypothetical protein